MLLAAGKGTRLGESGQRVAKVLVEIHGRPLLAWQLDHLAAEGFTRAVVNVHHLADQVERFVASFGGPIELLISSEPVLLGTAGGVANAWPLLAAERAVVVYGDVMPGPPLVGMVETHVRSGASITLAAYRAPASPEKGMVIVDEHDRVLGLREKDPDIHGDAWINAGLMVVERRATIGIAPGEEVDFGHDLIPAALERGARVQLHRLPGPVLDIGTPAALALAEDWPVSEN
jgi:NDP-sugar pyrophosphorylase family protein